jgi:triphosphatase
MSRVAEAPRPHALRLKADLTVGDGLQEMLASALAALHRHNTHAKNPSPEAVHRFRVSLRRLRSVLSAFSDTLPDLERRALGDQLRAQAQRYGRTREWDVFIGHTLPSLRKTIASEDEFSTIEHMAGEARRHALPPHETLHDGVAAIDAAIVDASWLRQPAPSLLSSWESPLRDHAATLLAKRHRRLCKGLKRADLTDQAAFHKLRIRVKKLRYPAELLKSLFDKKLASGYLERLVAVQDLLGGMNDALIARSLIAELNPAPVIEQLVSTWAENELEAYRDRFPRCRRAFLHAEPFWED